MAVIRTWEWEVENKDEWLVAAKEFGALIGDFGGQDFSILWPTTGPANVRVVSVHFDNWASVDRWNEWQETAQGKSVVKNLASHGNVVDRQSFEVL